MMTSLTPKDIICHLYELYLSKNYKYGETIIIEFSYGSIIHKEDIKDAINFFKEIKKQIPTKYAMILRKNSKVIIRPKINN